jgi:hypothetical protein
MLLRTCVRLVGTLTVKLLKGLKMTKLTDTSLEALLRKMIAEAPKTGAIPSNMLYWTNTPNPKEWLANCATTTNSWEIEVNFD